MTTRWTTLLAIDFDRHASAFSRALAAADPDSRTVVDLFAGGGLGAVGWHQRYWVYQQRKAGAA